MLTVDEIEDSFEVHFRQQVEDLPDETLHAILNNMHVLRRYAPPSLAASQARDIVADILRLRQPAPPAPEPEPVATEPEPQPTPEPPAIAPIEPYFAPEPSTEEPPPSLEPELRFESLPDAEAEPDDVAAEEENNSDDDDTLPPLPVITAPPPRPLGRWVLAAAVALGAAITVALLR